MLGRVFPPNQEMGCPRVARIPDGNKDLFHLSCEQGRVGIKRHQDKQPPTWDSEMFALVREWILTWLQVGSFASRTLGFLFYETELTGLQIVL